MKKEALAALGIGLLALAAACSRGKRVGDTVGVPECDEYIEKYTGCIARSPEGDRLGMEKAFKLQRDSFMDAVSTVEGRAPLKSTCRILLDALAANPYCK